jgi:hypothetical protein
VTPAGGSGASDDAFRATLARHRLLLLHDVSDRQLGANRVAVNGKLVIQL